MTDKILGFRPIFASKPGQIVMHAFIHCSKCGVSLSSTGGPGINTWCIKCTTEAINLQAAQHER